MPAAVDAVSPPVAVFVVLVFEGQLHLLVGEWPVAKLIVEIVGGHDGHRLTRDQHGGGLSWKAINEAGLELSYSLGI